MLLNGLLFLQLAFAVQNYEGQRDPPIPQAKKQFRLILRTPDRPCSNWRKVTPQLTKEDMLVSQSKRDEEGKGCKFIFVITPAETPGSTKFELEPFTGAKESFDLAAPAGYHPPPEAPPQPPSMSMSIPGVANENGTGLATEAVRGNLKLPGSIGVENVKPVNPGTGK